MQLSEHIAEFEMMLAKMVKEGHQADSFVRLEMCALDRIIQNLHVRLRQIRKEK